LRTNESRVVSFVWYPSVEELLCSSTLVENMQEDKQAAYKRWLRANNFQPASS
jgi:hypothetical protein